MSIYNPPTFSEYLSVFNPANWIPPATGGVDTAYLNANYAKYPVIQGTSYTLKNTTVSGSLAINNTGNKIIFTDSGSLGSINLTNAGSTNPTLQRTVAIGRDTIQGINNSSINTVAIGYQALKNSGASYSETDNTAVGAYSLLSQNNTNNLTNSNSAFGSSSLSNLVIGKGNSSLGNQSGVGGVGHQSGDYCTYLGASSGTNNSTCNYSTAVGAGAIISDNHQIQLGTGAEYVSVPNYIKFGDGTIQSTALPDQVYSALPDVFVSSSASNYDAGISIRNSNYFFTSTNPNSPTLSLPPFSAGLLNTTSINIYNTGIQTNPIIIKGGQTGQPQRLFVGKYGTYTSLLPVPVNSWVALRGNSGTDTYLVVDRGNFYPSEYFAKGTSVDLTSLPLSNSFIRIEPTANISAYIADISYTTKNNGGSFTIENLSNTYSINLQLVEDGVLTPSTTSVFTGLYGNENNVLSLPPLSNYTIFVNIANTGFDVINRTPNIQTYNLTSGGDKDYSSSQYFDTILNITGATNTNLTLPDPRKSLYPNAQNRIITVNNNSSGLITLLNYNASQFLGRYGNSATTIVVPDNTSFTLTSNGTNWEINARSSNVVYRNLSIGTTPNYSSNYNYLDSSLYLSGNANSTITWLNATATNAHLTTTKVYNTGAFQITLTSTPTFLGKYGSGTTSLIIPANTWVELFSDGTNWLVNDRTSNFNNTAITTVSGTLDLTTRYDFEDAYLYLNPTQIYTVNIPNPTSSQTGRIYTIENTHNYFYTTLSISSGVFTGAYGSEATTFILPENSWVKMYSNGTNWVVNNISNQGFSYYKTITASSFTLEAQYFKSYTAMINSNITVSLPTINPKSVNLPITVQLVATLANSANIVFSPNCTLVGSTYNVVSYISNYINRGAGNLGTRLLLTFDNAFFTSTAQRSAITFTPTKVSSTGSNTTGLTITCALGKRTATITTNSTNTINIGTIISADGNNYTITGLQTCLGGTCTGTIGGTSLALNTVSGIIFSLTPGQSIIISGYEYLITQLTAVGGSNSSATIYPSLLTSPAGTSFTALTGTGLAGTTGTYTLNKPALTDLSAGVAYTVVQDAYTWITI